MYTQSTKQHIPQYLTSQYTRHCSIVIFFAPPRGRGGGASKRGSGGIQERYYGVCTGDTSPLRSISLQYLGTVAALQVCSQSSEALDDDAALQW